MLYLRRVPPRAVPTWGCRAYNGPRSLEGDLCDGYADRSRRNWKKKNAVSFYGKNFRRRDFDLAQSTFANGVMAVHKPRGWTSSDVAHRIKGVLQRHHRNLTGEKRRVKVGHGGTLDPDATGVLVIGVGTGCKVMGRFLGGAKQYKARAVFGTETDTQDASGAVVAEAAWDHVDQESYEATLERFRGPLMQTPPMYSALRKNGRRLHELARAGEVVHRDPRPIEIFRLDSLAFDAGTEQLPAEFAINVECSSGTYIRTLVTDIGAACGSVAHLSQLVRTKQGPFTLDSGWCMPDEMWQNDAEALLHHLEACNQILLAMEPDEASDRASHGGGGGGRGGGADAAAGERRPLSARGGDAHDARPLSMLLAGQTSVEPDRSERGRRVLHLHMARNDGARELRRIREAKALRGAGAVVGSGGEAAALLAARAAAEAGEGTALFEDEAARRAAEEAEQVSEDAAWDVAAATAAAGDFDAFVPQPIFVQGLGFARAMRIQGGAADSADAGGGIGGAGGIGGGSGEGASGWQSGDDEDDADSWLGGRLRVKLVRTHQGSGRLSHSVGSGDLKEDGELAELPLWDGHWGLAGSEGGQRLQRERVGAEGNNGGHGTPFRALRPGAETELYEALAEEQSVAAVRAAERELVRDLKQAVRTKLPAEYRAYVLPWERDAAAARARDGDADEDDEEDDQVH